MEENEGVKKQSSKKAFEKNEHVCSLDSLEGIFLVSNSNTRLYLKLAGQDKSKLV